ncbi:MAG: hypothetical protein D6712_18915 [Chloroflexi bacterium]|nr:MAG: hypothetical protein D6712_18915 [Chloroflexota bacterium]
MMQMNSVYNIVLSDSFKQDLANLPPQIRAKMMQKLPSLAENPYHPGFRSEKQTVIRSRNIMRSRINHKYRFLWEWGNKEIILWRAGHHEMIDAITEIVDNDFNFEYWQHIRDEPEYVDNVEPIFACLPSTILRLLGVPEEALDDVLSITDPDEIWTLPVSRNVQEVLFSLLCTNTLDEVKEAIFDPSKLLYRTTVDHLVGYCEGRIRRLMLNLTEEQEALVYARTNGPLLIKGVAGSGKTTIGVYRALALVDELGYQPALFPDDTSKQILVLTYSSTLVKALRDLFRELREKMPEGLHVMTYDAWLRDFLRQQGVKYTRPKDETRKKFLMSAIERVKSNYPPNHYVFGLDADFLLDEFDQVLYGRGIFSLEEYQDLERHSRRIRLDRKEHRPVVWEIFREYKKLLWKHKNKYLDYGGQVLYILKHYEKILPKYRAVIIDEAQDLPPIRLKLASKLVDASAGDMRGLTLLADPAQSIYYRGIPWKEAGVEIRGRRTRVLTKNFRNTQPILEVAASILDRCEDLKQENEFIPPLSTHRLGPRPRLVFYREEIDQLEFIRDTILWLSRHQYRLGDIAILSRSSHDPATGRKPLHELEAYLSEHKIPCAYHRNDDFDIFENNVKLITMHSAKGLEFPVVFIIGLASESMPRIDFPKNEEEQLLQERKLLYVSMTRASEWLFMLCPKQRYSPFIRDDLDRNKVHVMEAEAGVS